MFRIFFFFLPIYSNEQYRIEAFNNHGGGLGIKTSKLICSIFFLFIESVYNSLCSFRTLKYSGVACHANRDKQPKTQKQKLVCDPKYVK